MGLSTLYEFSLGSEINPWRAFTRINAESLGLFTRRAQAYLDLSKNLSSCQTSDDFLTQQVTFWQVAQRQYMDSFQNSAFAVLPVAPVSEGSADQGNPERVRDYIVVLDTAASVVKAEKDAVPVKPANSERLRRSA